MSELPKRILAPFDFSAHSTAAVDYAVLLATRLGASLRLLHVYDPPDSMAGIVHGTSVHEEEDAVRQLAQQELDRLQKTLATSVAVDTAIVGGSPVEEILRHAKEGNFDLIVMGTHARSGLSRVLLGSVTEEVMRHTTVPVLVVHLPTKA